MFSKVLQKATSVLTPLHFSWENSWYKVVGIFTSRERKCASNRKVTTSKNPKREPQYSILL